VEIRDRSRSSSAARAGDRRTKGIGEAIVRRLAAGGAKVATTARSELPKASSRPVRPGRRQHGSRHREHRPERSGSVRRVDLLVHNVGGSSAPAGGFAALGDEDWAQALDGNLLAAVRLDRACFPE